MYWCFDAITNNYKEAAEKSLKETWFNFNPSMDK